MHGGSTNYLWKSWTDGLCKWCETKVYGKYFQIAGSFKSEDSLCCLRPFSNTNWLFQQFYISHGYITYRLTNWNKIISK